MKKTTHQLEEDFRKQTKEGLPQKEKTTLEKALERYLWDKKEENKEPDGEWI